MFIYKSREIGRQIGRHKIKCLSYFRETEKVKVVVRQTINQYAYCDESDIYIEREEGS